jgi:hypothetical protein
VIVVYAQRFRPQVKAAQKWLDEHGPVAENARTRGLRRVYLARLDSRVFYRYDARRQEITFTAFRHARRRPIRM